MSILIQYLTNTGARKNIEIDCKIEATHDFAAESTQFPVESGSVISDHIINKPKTLQIHGVVTNSPLVLDDVDPARMLNTFDKLMDIRDNKYLVTVVTEFGLYENMVMNSLSLPRNAAVGDSLDFSASFGQIEIVSSKFVTLPNVSNSKKSIAQNTIDKSKTPTQEASAGQKTWLASLTDSLAGAGS